MLACLGLPEALVGLSSQSFFSDQLLSLYCISSDGHDSLNLSELRDKHNRYIISKSPGQFQLSINLNFLKQYW